MADDLLYAVAVALVLGFAVLALGGCVDTIRNDPKPRWDAYSIFGGRDE